MPEGHDEEPVHPISHDCCPHETLPAHAPLPVQHTVVVCAALEIVPEQPGLPEHVTSHFVVELIVMLPLHAWSLHETVAVCPLVVMFALHALVSHVTLHVCAVHVMSLSHDKYPQWRSQLDPPHAIVPVHSLPPLIVQSILHDDDLLQSMSPQAW